MTVPETYMNRCLQLASQGLGNVAPNPLVGAVIVDNGNIIGEGFHKKFGEPHAEVHAIEQVVTMYGAESLKRSVLYVSLEPCCHHGKTPPCTDLIIKMKIPDVVIACPDPFHQVDGAGINQLKDAGIKVTVGVCEKEAQELNKRFFTFHKQRRPYVILKWAQSQDGFIAPIRGNRSKQISNNFSRMQVHKWRTEESAILVGTNTVLEDNPHLTARYWPGADPVRITIDRTNYLPDDLNIFKEPGRVIVFTETANEKKDNIEKIMIKPGSNQLNQVMEHLFARGIQSVLVEGGAKLLQSFINRNLWDEIRMFYCPVFLNKGISAPTIDFTKMVSKTNKTGDELFIFRNS